MVNLFFLTMKYRTLINNHILSHLGVDQDRSRSYVAVQFASRDEQSHQLGRDIYLQCSVQGNVDRPYEYVFTKDGRPLEDSKLKIEGL